ncbi:lytic transglycosylase domain-containing protein [Amaricoccus macauensis]|uniref:lytic transglycosylase domain-containing protein n=1 Tax=Amaricoccus macauensis TaxID=57001 RepID=UPI003C7A5487
MVKKRIVLLAAAWACVSIMPANAQSLLNSRSSLSPEYQALIRKPVPGALKGQLRRPSQLEDGEWTIPRYSGSRGVYQDMARAAARRHQIPEDLFLRLVSQESNFVPAAKSSKGAIGLAQLMPGTARLLGVNPHDPKQNLEGGARYLSQQYRKFGDWRLALAAYNAGPNAVVRYKGVPPYKETQNYVKKILGR